MEKKIYAFKFYLILTVVVICLIPVSAFLIIKAFISGIDILWGGIPGVLAAIAVCLIVARNFYVAINFDKKSVRHTGYPVILDRSYRYRDRQKYLELVNSGELSTEVFLPDATSVEIFKFSKAERKNIRRIQIFNKYLKFSLVNGKQNYIPIAMYSKRQIKRLIAGIREVNPAIQTQQN